MQDGFLRYRYLAATLLLCSLMLAACGGGFGGSAGSAVAQTQLLFPLTPDGHYNPGPVRARDDARHLLAYSDNRHSFVAINQGTAHVGNLREIGTRANIEVQHGRLNDGVGRTTVAEFLMETSPRTVRRYGGSPQVRVIGSATAREQQFVANAVRVVDAGLPGEARMRLEAPMPGFSLRPPWTVVASTASSPRHP